MNYYSRPCEGHKELYVQKSGTLKVTVNPRGSHRSAQPAVEKKPLEIVIKGHTYTGKTHIAEIIRRALVEHGIEHKVECQDTDMSKLEFSDCKTQELVDFINSRNNIVIIDNNERPGNR